MSMMVSFVLSFFPRDVLDEILNLIESVSEDFPSYFSSGGHLVYRRNDFSYFGREFWLVACFGLNDPLRQYFSLYLPEREGERKKK